MGAPVVAFCRIADTEIRLREPIQEPDALIVQDPTLFKALDVTEGLKSSGYLIVNTARSFAEMHLDAIVARLPKGHALTAPARPPFHDVQFPHQTRPLIFPSRWKRARPSGRTTCAEWSPDSSSAG